MLWESFEVHFLRPPISMELGLLSSATLTAQELF